MDRADIEAHVDAASAVLGLAIAPEHRPGVIGYFALAAEMAEVVHGLPLGRDDEPAAVFVPVAPSGPAAP